MKVSTERLAVEQASDGQFLVTLDHQWTDEERVVFTVKVPKGNHPIANLQDTVTRSAIALLQKRLRSLG